SVHAGDPTDNPAMKALALKSGCLTCHSIAASRGDQKQLPIAPAWEDVAKKYHGQKDAVAKLTQVVLQGSSPYASHWKEKVSGLAMPPNTVAIGESDARQLVRWILTLNQ